MCDAWLHLLNRRRKEIVGKPDQWRLRLFHVDLSRDVPFEASDCCHLHGIYKLHRARNCSTRSLAAKQPNNSKDLASTCCVLRSDNKTQFERNNLRSHMTELGRHHETSSLLVDEGKGGF